MSFRRRTYPEILENMITAMLHGVAAESHPFPPPGAPPYRHRLQRPPVGDLGSIFGSRDGRPAQFRKNADYKLLDDRQTIEWQKGAQLPDPGTLISVNYFPADAAPALTDFQTGSVVRTVTESVALEMARLYALLDTVYQSGFIDTASERALDNVVALLGIDRVTGGRAVGELEFTRAPAMRGAIYLPAGTRVITPDGNVEYVTTASVTMMEGQSVIRVPARDREPNDPLPAGALTVLPTPIAGIVGVTNPAPTAVTTRDETDEELRDRAKNFLHGSERATLGALKEALARQGIGAEIVEDREQNQVVVRPHAKDLPPELVQRLLTAIEDARPAGVRVTLAEGLAPRQVNLAARFATTAGLAAQEMRAAQRGFSEKVNDLFGRLRAGEPVNINRVAALALNLTGVENFRLVRSDWADGRDALDRDKGEINLQGAPPGTRLALGELQVCDPNLPTQLNVAVSYPKGKNAPVAPDAAAIKAALAPALAYLNDANKEDSSLAARTITYSRLLSCVPLPDRTTLLLKDYDAQNEDAKKQPNEKTIVPYQVRFDISLESGLTRTLAAAADRPYVLIPLERLSLNNVELKPRPADA